ncbi:4'-phosphopantetheinyl transferase superfamily protein [Salinisphaera sp. T31B1]|uniref:4'-phosphopantetheinyl transferase family protein n=1 Tax=Salinisphaera sp. T31B1 TaxID=727963 RepID=UPI003340EA48
MRSPAARARTQTGLWLLACALEQAGYDRHAIERIGLDARGRPRIDGAAEFSISHSQALVACALADSPDMRIGLDVEHRRPVVPDRLGRLIGDAERPAIEQTPARFFDYWCAREATVKASGRVGLKRIRAITLDEGGATLDGRRWITRSIELAPGYAACLACDRPLAIVRLRSQPLSD